LGLMRTYFLAFSAGRIRSSIAVSASYTFLRRLSPLIRATSARRLVYGNNLATLAVAMRGSCAFPPCACGTAPTSTGGFCCACKASP
jgi:hypothetical protein